jgi:hypothetical protein
MVRTREMVETAYRHFRMGLRCILCSLLSFMVPRRFQARTSSTPLESLEDVSPVGDQETVGFTSLKSMVRSQTTPRLRLRLRPPWGPPVLMAR